ncbi:hypothetical protein A5630_23120 [Mycolicibacterium mucogenicum]|uniref:Lysin B n=1 Tax=Mycolicibacterium mucogenicum TaxID=56689 RepID=A0A1A3H149_MYCMU|nr:hypothetical protein [Mycolicibacterium mucogenicum]OBJ41334.1 hypothetical protein A5630_23120 [Mycolicibacterium mucogenicum]
MTQRHLAIVFRGTGGIIGQDYVSRVCQGVSDIVEEINPEFDATMGGIPVGAANGLGGKSMRRAVDEAVWDATGIIMHALHLNPKRKIIVGGYSAGAVAAARVRKWLLTNFPDNYLCSFSIGDPTRPAGGAFYKGVPCPGRGISTWKYGDIRDYRHCWLAAPGDMYTSVPDNRIGDIMDTAYEIVSGFQLSDPFGTAQRIGEQIPVILGEAALDPLAAFRAMGIAAQFVSEGTAPHIQYEFREVWPGKTYLDLAIQHVRDWASRYPLT